MLQFIKKWHQAFQADKAVRSIADVKNSVQYENPFKKEARKWSEAISESMEESSKEDWNGRERY